MLFFLKTSALCLCVAAQTVFGYPNMDLAMKIGTVVHEGDYAEFPKYRNGKRTIRYPRDGNWATQNGFFTGGWDANQNSACASWPPHEDRKMTYRLQRDGNFVAMCGDDLDYVTRTGQGGPGDYFLAIDDACILHIFQGTWDCDSIDFGEEPWTNIRTKPLERGDRLGKDEMVRFQDGTVMVIQSSDGNLVVYGQNVYDTALWGANQEWDAPPASNFRDRFARITNNGWLILVGRDLDSGEELVYFRKNLHSNGATCFTVEYDANVDDLVAVPCSDNDPLRRDLHLRGSYGEDEDDE